MKTRKLTLLATLILISATVFGQNYAFKVLANKGNNEVKTGGTWQPLKTGASLQSADELKIAENSYIGLVHSSGKPMELKDAKSWKVSDLEQNVGKGTSVLNKYTDFILSSNSAEAKKNRLSATGAVVRDLTEIKPIKLMLPENQHSGIYNNFAVINWDGSKVPGPYIVTVKNMFEEELTKLETPETTLQIDLTDAKYASLTAILVVVSAKSDAKQVSKQHMIKRLPPAEQEKIKTSLSEILGSVAEENALHKYILAGFYEEHGLFIDAIAAYKEAMELAPDVPTYSEGYEEFLLRHGLNR